MLPDHLPLVALPAELSDEAAAQLQVSGQLDLVATARSDSMGINRNFKADWQRNSFAGQGPTPQSFFALQLSTVF